MQFLETLWENVLANIVASLAIPAILFVLFIFRKHVGSLLIWLRNSFAIGVATFFAFGFRLWAEKVRSSEDVDDLWNWLNDQLLAAQSRHAFAFGCVIFRRNANEMVETLLIKRQFLGFKDRVFLWPGGRIRGVPTEEALPKVILNLVEREARCAIRLVGPITDSEEVFSVSQDMEQTIRNQINPPPLLIMRQNRPQRNGVPGHIDLIFVGQYLSANNRLSNQYETVWLTIDQVKNHSEEWVLWPDTKQVILRAAKWFEDHSSL